MSPRKQNPKTTAKSRRGGKGVAPARAFRTIQFSRRDAVATVTLDRPDVLNAYNVEMRDELHAAFSAVDEDATVRVLVLRGNGPAFCSGGDVSEFGTAPSPLMARWVRWRRDVWGLLSTLDAITVAAVHGHAAGSGLEMALLCDILLVADDAVMLLPECGLGMIPGVGGTQTLPRAVGVGRALDIVLTGQRVDAREAVRIALANRTVPRADLDRAAQELADHVATLSSAVVAAVKRCVARGLDLPLVDGLAMERRIAARTVGEVRS
jgi:enoyl-CoA hydratase/carnithine racemase